MKFNSSTRRALYALSGFACACVLASATQAQNSGGSKLDTAARRSRNAAAVLNKVFGPGDETIPRELLERAKGVAVFPDVDKINLLIEKAMQGYGVVCARRPEGWSPPAYYSFGMAELSLTSLGAKKPDVIILFMNDNSLKAFERGRFRFKGEMMGYAGPVGRMTLDKENSIRVANVIIYALADGRLSGLKAEADLLSDAALNPDNNINKAVYGMKGREVLAGKAPRNPAPPAVDEFRRALAELSKK